MRLLSALLAATLALTSDGRAQLLPFGEFAARDGRPGVGKTWKVSNERGRLLAAVLTDTAKLTPVVVDYDHQTMFAATTGNKAPASGWITKVEWLDGQGLFATVDWTDAAKALIDSKEYRFISPVIQWDDATGEITGVLMAALVNYPALVGMQAVQAAEALSALNHSQPEQHRMNLLAKLIAALGLPSDTTEDSALTALSAIKVTADAAKVRPLLPAALAGALGVAATADEAAALAAITTLKTPAKTGETDTALLTQVAALQAQITTLQASTSENEVTALVDKAINDAKFVPAMRDNLLALGRKDKTALSAFITAAPELPGLKGQATAAAAAAAAAATAAPTNAALAGADALAVAAQMGISAEAWKKAIAPAATA
jgi:phage I-like protein